MQGEGAETPCHSPTDAPQPAPPEKGKGQKDLTSGPVAKTLFFFALPSLGVNVLQSVNNSVNAIWIGRFLGEEALAATANAGMVLFLMFSTLFGFSMATTIMIGQYMGRKEIDNVRRTLGSSLSLFAIAGIITAAIGWIFSPQLLTLLGTPAGAYDLALTYLRIIFLSMPGSFLLILISSALRGVGDAITPMRASFINIGLDIVLNPILILGLGPLPAMGIAGSATATLISGLIATALLIRSIYKKDLLIRLRGAEFSYLRPNRQFSWPVIRMGFPLGLTMIIMSSSALAMIGLVNREGVETTAAYGLMNQLWSYVQMPAVAVGSAVSAMAAQNIGAGKWDRVNKIALAGVTINLLMTILVLSIITLGARPLLELFVDADSPAIPIAIHMNNIVGWSYIAMGISMVLSFLVRANGAVTVPLLILFFSAVIVRFAVALGLYPDMGGDAIWWAFDATGLTSLILTLAYYLQGSWRKLKPLGKAAKPQTA